MNKKIFLILAIIFSCSAEAANINRGDVELGGAYSLSTSTGQAYDYSGAATTVWSVQGSGQYFLHDHFSAGLNATWFVSNHSKYSVSIGPAATYYFLVKDNAAPFVMVVPISWSKSDAHFGYVFGSSEARVGVKLFLTDSVAFAPALQYQHSYEYGGVNIFSFIGVFAIHL